MELEASFRQSAEVAGAMVLDFVPSGDASTPAGGRALIQQISSQLSEADSKRCGPLWWTADLSNTLGRSGAGRHVRDLERSISELLTRFELKVLCRWDRRLLDESTESSLSELHDNVTSFGAPPDLRVFWVEPARLVVAGQVDGGAVQILDRLLDGSPSEGLVVDLSLVDFVDAAGASVLCRPAFNGGQVSLIGVSPLVSRVLRLAELESLPGVTIETRP